MKVSPHQFINPQHLPCLKGNKPHAQNSKDFLTQTSVASKEKPVQTEDSYSIHNKIQTPLSTDSKVHIVSEMIKDLLVASTIYFSSMEKEMICQQFSYKCKTKKKCKRRTLTMKDDTNLAW